MDKSQHVTRSAGKAPPLPPVPPKPAPEFDGARPERLPGTRAVAPAPAQRSAMPWAVAGGAAVLLVGVIAVASILLVTRSREQAVLARANADEAQRQARATEERERLQRTVLESQLEAANASIEQLRKQADLARTEADRREIAGREEARTEFRKRISELEQLVQSAGKSDDPGPFGPRGRPPIVGDDQAREMRDLRRQLEQALDKIAAMRETDFPPRPGMPKKGDPFAQRRVLPRHQPEAKPGTLSDPGNLGEYAKNIGKIYKFTVTGDDIGTIYGSNPYTTDSPLAVAAVHSGALKVGETGVIQVTILKGQLSYRSTMRNGIASNEWGQFEASYRITK